MIIQILDVLIGLAVVYLIFSTIASSAVELIETVLRRRGLMLLRGIEEIFKVARVDGARGVGAAELQQLVKTFYQLAPIASLYVGDVEADGKQLRVRGGQLPSYIPPARFAGAIVAGAAAELSDGFSAADKQRFQHVADLAWTLYGETRVAGVAVTQQERRDALEKFFNDNTERMTSWYRRYVQWVLAGIGVVLAVALNINSLHIVKVLSEDSTVRTRIVNQALSDMAADGAEGFRLSCDEPAVVAKAGSATSAAAAKDERTPGTVLDTPDEQNKALAECEKKLREGIKRRLGYASSLGLPIGWSNDSVPDRALDGWSWAGAWLAKLLGWLMTALAVCVGAPFWFDLINKLANIRTALKPDDDEQGAAQTR